MIGVTSVPETPDDGLREGLYPRRSGRLTVHTPAYSGGFDIEGRNPHPLRPENPTENLSCGRLALFRNITHHSL